MQKQTIVVVAVVGVFAGGFCLLTGILGGILFARGLQQQQREPAQHPLGPVATPPGGNEEPVSPTPRKPADEGGLPADPKRDPVPAPEQPVTRSNDDEPWEKHSEPGFAVSVPRSWRVESDRATGRARLSGPRGEQVLAWPIFVNSSLDGTSAGHLLEHLAEKLISSVKWMLPTNPRPGVVRCGGLNGGPSEAVAIMTWQNGPEGAAGQALFAVPGQQGLNSDVVARIFGSFRATGAPSSGNAAAAPPTLRYERWNDPVEHAWSTEVPSGWKTEGGLRRFAPTDVRGEVVSTSADGFVRVTLGDWEMPTFSEPTQMGTQLGFREGTWYSPSGLQKFMIHRYMTGLEVGRDYLKNKIGQVVGGLNVVKERDRPDLVANFNEQARQNPMPNTTCRATAGELAFEGTLNGRPCVGSYFVGTQVTTTQAPGIEPISLWQVVILSGYAAVKEKAATGGAALDHMVKTFEFTPEWVRMQQNITMDSARIVHDTNVDVSKKISDSYWARSAGESELSRRRSNATLGVEDVTDPNGGQTYKVESGSNYYWLDDRGNIVGTNTPGAPTIDFRELVRQP